MTRLDRIAQGLLRPINPYSTIILGAFTALWGVWILAGWPVFSHAALYSKMAEFAPEWAWGTWSLCAGLLVVLAVFKGFYRWLIWTLLFIGWHWATVSIFMWWGDWQNTGGLTYTTVAIYSGYCYLNVKFNYLKRRSLLPTFHH
jgi:hypothetical protein